MDVLVRMVRTSCRLFMSAVDDARDKMLLGFSISFQVDIYVPPDKFLVRGSALDAPAGLLL